MSFPQLRSPRFNNPLAVPQPPPAGLGQIKYFNGTTWDAKPVKIWNGSSWDTKPVKQWDGGAWVTTNY